MAVQINYNGSVIADLSAGQTATLNCKDKVMRSNVVVTAPESMGSGGGGSLDGFHMVRFYNDDRTTLLYTVYVPHGSGAIYAGDTPISTVNAVGIFRGFEPTAENITEDMDCYAIYDVIGTLNETSWEDISRLSETDMAQNYFAIGDTKTIHIEGTVGTLGVNNDFDVYIIGFNHNEAIEKRGITFGTFKTPNTPSFDYPNAGVDIAFFDSNYLTASEDGTKAFNVQHWGNNNYGGWAGCDMRYDILGSTDVPPSDYGAGVASGRKGNNPSDTCTSNPVANTLMAALPADLRAVLKPITKYTDNVAGGSNNKEANVTATVDYLPLMSEYEIFGSTTYSNNYEKYRQERYAYYAEGNSAAKYKRTGTEALHWWVRSPYRATDTTFCYVNAGKTNWYPVNRSHGLAPIFKV
jgi:hypothetical protein